MFSTYGIASQYFACLLNLWLVLEYRVFWSQSLEAMVEEITQYLL